MRESVSFGLLGPLEIGSPERVLGPPRARNGPGNRTRGPGMAEACSRVGHRTSAANGGGAGTIATIEVRRLPVRHRPRRWGPPPLPRG
jgi:hypothetical protein